MDLNLQHLFDHLIIQVITCKTSKTSTSGILFLAASKALMHPYILQ